MSAMFSNNSGHNDKKREKTLVEIVQIVFRRRYLLIGSIVVTLVIAFLYNVLTTPVYKSSVLLKKESSNEKNSQGEFADILSVQSSDEIETEMALINTWSVLSSVVDDLQLNIEINSIITPEGKKFQINETMLYCKDPNFLAELKLPFNLPEFNSVELKGKKVSGEYYVKKAGPNTFKIYSALDDRLINVYDGNLNPNSSGSSTNNYADSLKNIAELELPVANIKLSWPDAPIGSILYFKILNYYKTMESLNKQISVDRKGNKTNVFEVSIKSSSAYASTVIANKVVDSFRESRINQQKQTIRYSFKFVDEQLVQMKNKLNEAEDNLSKFKSSGQITTIDQSSQDLIRFLSQLETEKVNTDLQLADYKNKVEDMKKEMRTQGFVDQNLLSPSGGVDRNSPFSSLLKQISDLELQRLELLQRRTEQHPDVIALDQQIRLAKQKLNSYNQNTLTAYNIIIKSLEKKLLKISNLMSKYEVKLEMLPAKENRLARLMRQKNVYEKINNLLLDKREEMRMAELSKLQDIIIVDPAHEPVKPVSPKKLLNLIIALIIGNFIGLLVVFIFELRDNRLISLDELEQDFNLPVFAIIPTYTNAIKDKIENAKDSRDKFVTLMDEQEGFKETYRLLKTKLLFQMEGREKIFMITSCDENTGKTSIVANLAVSIAQENKKVLVIDCDLRKAELSKMFELPRTAPGLIEFIEKDVAPTIYTKILKNIDILPTGGTREDSSHLLNSERMRLLFNAIDTSSYDYIIIDTPPVTRVVDTLVLGKSVKDAILVVRPKHSPKEAVMGGIQEMLQAKIKIRGIVANAAEIKNSYYYRYRYGYGYGYSTNEEPTDKVKRGKRHKLPEMSA